MLIHGWRGDAGKRPREGQVVSGENLVVVVDWAEGRDKQRRARYLRRDRQVPVRTLRPHASAPIRHLVLQQQVSDGDGSVDGLTRAANAGWVKEPPVLCLSFESLVRSCQTR